MGPGEVLGPAPRPALRAGTKQSEASDQESGRSGARAWRTSSERAAATSARILSRRPAAGCGSSAPPALGPRRATRTSGSGAPDDTPAPDGAGGVAGPALAGDGAPDAGGRSARAGAARSVPGAAWSDAASSGRAGLPGRAAAAGVPACPPAAATRAAAHAAGADRTA